MSDANRSGTSCFAAHRFVFSMLWQHVPVRFSFMGFMNVQPLGSLTRQMPLPIIGMTIFQYGFLVPGSVDRLRGCIDSYAGSGGNLEPTGVVWGVASPFRALESTDFVQ